MFGFYFTEHGVSAQGVLFDNNHLYVHEPIADHYASQEDLMQDHPSGVFQLIGPVVMTDLARKYLEQDYQLSFEIIENHTKHVEASYRKSMDAIDRREGTQSVEEACI